MIPDYQLQNAALGVYDEAKRAACQATVAAFRDEFYRLKTAIENATTLAELEAIKPAYPTELVKP
jgi:hypothetical protein